MNKLLIVGHPASGLHELEPVLRRSGFRPALPSLREGLRPDDFVASVVKSLDLRGNDFQQVQPGQAWQTLAADLLLGNENQGPWFWMCPELLPLLEFWKEQDPGFLIVMVYDDPHCAIGADSEKPGDHSVRQQLANWESYNQAMLRFHQQNQHRSVLLHGRNVILDSDAVVGLIRERMTADLVSSGSVDGDESVSEGAVAVIPVSRPDVAARYLKEAVIAQEPAAGKLYQELQVAASLPAGQEPAAPSLDEALADLVAHGASVRRWVEELKGKEHARKIWEFHLAEIQEGLEQNYLDTQGYRWRLREATRLLEAPHGAAQRVKQHFSYRLGSAMVNGTRSVGGFLLMPLVLAVEILHFTVMKLCGRKEKLPPLREYADYEAAEKVKQQLSYRIGRTVLANLKSPVGWLRLPCAISKEITEFKKCRGTKVSEKPEA